MDEEDPGVGDSLVVVDSLYTEEAEVWENERYYPFIGWSSTLLPTDRSHFSDNSGIIELNLKTVPLPPRFIWIDTNWKIDSNAETDEDGWYYAPDFSSQTWHARNQPMDTARRRRYIRTRGMSISTSHPEYIRWFALLEKPHDSYCDRLVERWTGTNSLCWKKMQDSPISYEKYVKEAKFQESRREERINRNDGDWMLDDLDQIERDIGRTDPAGFSIISLRNLLLQDTEPGDGDSFKQNALRRVLSAYACRNIGVGYVQGLNFVVRLLLAIMTETQAFWLLAVIVEDYRLPDFYSRMPVGMSGLRTTLRLFKRLVIDCAKREGTSPLSKLLASIGSVEMADLIETSAPRFLIPLFLNSVPLDTTLFILDRFFVRRIPPLVEHRLDTPLFEVMLLLLNAASPRIMEEPECRTHEFLEHMKNITAMDMWRLLSSSSLHYPDARELKEKLVEARANILDDWIYSDSFLRVDPIMKWNTIQMDTLRSCFLPLAFVNARNSIRLGIVKSAPKSSLYSNNLAPGAGDIDLREVTEVIDSTLETLAIDRDMKYNRLSSIISFNPDNEMVPYLIEELEILRTQNNLLLPETSIVDFDESLERKSSSIRANAHFASSPADFVNVGDSKHINEAISLEEVSSVVESLIAPVSTEIEMVESNYTTNGISLKLFDEILLISGFKLASVNGSVVTQRMFTIADADGDGELDIREFLTLISILKSGDYVLTRFVFQIFDLNSSGFIELDEALCFSPAFEKLQIASLENENKVDESVNQESSSWVHDLFKLDLDQDGFISFSEFQAGVGSKFAALISSFLLNCLFFPPIEEECWENERFIVLLGWNAANLHKTESMFSDFSNKPLFRETISSKLLSDWTWIDDWHVDKTLNDCDEEGWLYAPSFHSDFCVYGAKSAKSYVRRRKWIRNRKYTRDLLSLESDSTSDVVLKLFEKQVSDRKLRETEQQKSICEEELQHKDLNLKLERVMQAEKMGF